MKRTGYRTGFLAILISMLLLVQTASVWAGGFSEEIAQTQTMSSSYVNPGYEQLFDYSQKPEQNLLPGEAPVYQAGQSFTTEAACITYLRQQMVNRQASVTFTLKGVKIADVGKWLENVYNQAMADTGSTGPKEGDYLRWNTLGYAVNVSFNSYEGWYTATYQLQYCSTLAEENWVDRRIPQVLTSLSLTNKNTYEKIKAIYDYVTKHVTYDYAGLSRGEAGAHSAYRALAKGTAVCQGYSTLVYRLLRESGISCRFIYGYSQGQNHGWNIVRLGSYYYNLDATWDAGQGSYQYFLKSMNDFEDHTRDAEFRTEAFQAKYPMASKSYVYVPPVGTPKLGKAVAQDYNKIKISWGKVSGINGYYIYRKTGSGGYTRIGKASSTATTYVDSTAQFGVTYIYTVRAYRTSGGATTLSGYDSKGITGRTVYLGVPQPSAVTAGKKTTLTWKAINGAQGYSIYRKAVGDKSYKLLKNVAAPKGTTCSYVDATIAANTQYIYAVRAYRKYGSTVYRGRYLEITPKAGS